MGVAGGGGVGGKLAPAPAQTQTAEGELPATGGAAGGEG